MLKNSVPSPCADKPLDTRRCLQRGQTIWFVTSWVVTQEELGQQPEKQKENMQSVTGWINDVDTCNVGASVGNTEKAGHKAVSLQSIENRKCYETEKEKGKFICESFQLDTNAILKTDAK